MVKISCSNYGFDCEFESSGNNSMVIKKYQKHSMDEHGIEHSEEALEQLLIEKIIKIAKCLRPKNIDYLAI